MFQFLKPCSSSAVLSPTKQLNKKYFRDLSFTDRTVAIKHMIQCRCTAGATVYTNNHLAYEAVLNSIDISSNKNGYLKLQILNVNCYHVHRSK